MNHSEKLNILYGLDGCHIVYIMHKFGCNVVIIIIWFLHALTSFFEFISSEARNSKTHNRYRRTGEAARNIGGRNRRAEPAESQTTLWQGHPCRMGLQLTSNPATVLANAGQSIG